MNGYVGTPWETSAMDSGGEVAWDVCEAEAGDMVASICGTGDLGEKRANLIAAAPDGLEAAKALQKWSWTLPHAFREADEWHALDAFIKKAEGQT